MAAEDKIEVDGKEYILSREAAEATGYTQDYVGQLARRGSILSKRVGGLWYVNQESLKNHKSESQSHKSHTHGAHNATSKKTTGGPDKHESLVMLDGKEYVTTKRAAELTGYTKDYIGQLARGGKISRNQVGGQQYVLKSDLTKHQKDKDTKLAAVQASAVGIKESEPVNTRIDDDGPLLKYLPDEGDDLPEITKGNRQGISESRNLGTDNKDAEEPHSEAEELDDENVTHHVAVRAMAGDSERVKATSASVGLSKQQPFTGRTVHRTAWNTKDVGNNKVSNESFSLHKVVAGISLVIVIGIGVFYAFSYYTDGMRGPLPNFEVVSGSNSNNRVIKVFESVVDVFNPSVQYKRL